MSRAFFSFQTSSFPTRRGGRRLANSRRSRLARDTTNAFGLFSPPPPRERRAQRLEPTWIGGINKPRRQAAGREGSGAIPDRDGRSRDLRDFAPSCSASLVRERRTRERIDPAQSITRAALPTPCCYRVGTAARFLLTAADKKYCAARGSARRSYCGGSERLLPFPRHPGCAHFSRWRWRTAPERRQGVYPRVSGHALRLTCEYFAGEFRFSFIRACALPCVAGMPVSLDQVDLCYRKSQR